jgi:zinc transporter
MGLILDSSIRPGEAVWGADLSGLIAGFEFAPGRSTRSVDSEIAAELLRSFRSSQSEDRFIWLHFDLAHSHAQRWLQRHAQLPESFYEALSASVRSTRVERVGDAMVAVVNDVVFDFDFDPGDLTTLWVCLDSHLIVTGRQRRLRSVDALRQKIKDGAHMLSPMDLLEHLLREQCDVLTDIVRQVTQRTDAIEDRLLAGRNATQRTTLGEMRRLLVRLRRLMAPEPTSLFRLLQHPPSWVSAQSIQALREVNEEFLVALSDMASLQERIKLLQEEVAAGVNEATGRSLFMLTVMTVLALPINILAGLFGMNVGGIPLADNPHGFWVIAGIILVFAVAATQWVVRRRKD